MNLDDIKRAVDGLSDSDRQQLAAYLGAGKPGPQPQSGGDGPPPAPGTPVHP